jgi:hypothetical protein
MIAVVSGASDYVAGLVDNLRPRVANDRPISAAAGGRPRWEASWREGLLVASFPRHKQKTRPLGALFAGDPIKKLLDFGFLEFNVLAYNRVILRLRHLVRERTAVLGGDVEGTGVGCRQQLDLDCCSFRHGRPAFKQKRSRRRFSPRLNLARNYVSRPKSQACFARKTKRNP